MMAHLGFFNRCKEVFSNFYGLFPLPETDSDSDTDTDSCTMQNFSTGLDLESDPLIEI